MRAIPASLAIFLGGTAASFAAAADQTVPAPVAACIDAYAPQIEATVPSLTQGTSFIVDDLCAESIAVEQQNRLAAYRRNMYDRYSALCSAQNRAPTSPEFDPCAIAQSLSENAPPAAEPAEKMPEATAYAAKLLLKLRLARANPGSPH